MLVAALRRWSLVQTKDNGVPSERLYALSPIRAYVRQQWREEHPSEAQALTETLLRDFSVMAAVIDIQSEDAASVPYMISRFSEELPNLFLVIDEAEIRPGNAELGALAAAICAALMRFFFIARLPQQGVQLMTRGARIAARDGNWKDASAKIVQAASLVQRGQDPRMAAEVEMMLDGFPTEDAETCGNIAMTRAILTKQRGDALAAEGHARDAIAHYQMVRNELATQLDQETDELRWEENNNDLSGSFQMLGDALLALKRPGEARTAYEGALRLVSGGSVAVNEGQILHQIGNCQSNLGEHADAADYYARAAVCFQAVGMKEYLSNALCGLGYALMEFDDERPLPEAPPSIVLSEGLDDSVESVVRCLSATHQPNDGACAWAIGKLFGVVVVLGFSDEAWRLGEVGGALKKWVTDAHGDGVNENAVGRGEKLEWLHVDALAALMSTIAAFEERVDTVGRVRERDIDQLSKAWSAQGPWTGLKSSSFDWLGVYLRRKWSFTA